MLWYYTVGDWQLILILFYLIPLALVIGASIFFLKDTPMCLVTRYSPEDALNDLTFIAKLNKKSDFAVTEKDISRVRRVYQSKLEG